MFDLINTNYTIVLVFPPQQIYCITLCIPLRLVLGRYLAQTGALVQHSVSAENLPQTTPPYSAPTRRTKPAETQHLSVRRAENFTTMMNNAQRWCCGDPYLFTERLALYEGGCGISSNPANQGGEQSSISMVTQGILHENFIKRITNTVGAAVFVVVYDEW